MNNTIYSCSCKDLSFTVEMYESDEVEDVLFCPFCGSILEDEFSIDGLEDE